MASFIHPTSVVHAMNHIVRRVQSPQLTAHKVRLYDGLTSTGGNEISGNGYNASGYTMASPAWTGASGGVAQNSSAVPGITASGGTITASEWGWTADDGGGDRFVLGSSLAVSIPDGQTQVMAAGAAMVKLGQSAAGSTFNTVWLDKWLDHYTGHSSAWDPATDDGNFLSGRYITISTQPPETGDFHEVQTIGVDGFARVDVGANWTNANLGLPMTNTSQPDFENTNSTTAWPAALYWILTDSPIGMQAHDWIVYGRMFPVVIGAAGSGAEFFRMLSGSLKIGGRAV